MLVNTDGMEILNAKKLKKNQMKDIVKPQPVVGNKEKHPTLLRGMFKRLFNVVDDWIFSRA